MVLTFILEIQSMQDKFVEQEKEYIFQMGEIRQELSSTTQLAQEEKEKYTLDYENWTREKEMYESEKTDVSSEFDKLSKESGALQEEIERLEMGILSLFYWCAFEVHSRG